MAINLKKKTSKPKSEEKSEKSEKAKVKKPVGGFLAKGIASKKGLEKAEIEAEKRKEEQGKAWRFYLKDGESEQCTFLDGDLDDDGFLDLVSFHQHTERLNGKWENFIVDPDQPDPIQETTGKTPAFCAVFTVFVHKPWKDQDGNEHEGSRRLFVAKRQTIKQLQKLAEKRGGLTGCTFEISRTGDKMAGVGDMFDFEDKNSIADLAEHLGIEEKDMAPLNYEEELTFYSEDQLRTLGFGNGSPSIGSADTTSGGDDSNYEDDL
jgi:hypothetical protein